LPDSCKVTIPCFRRSCSEVGQASYLPTPIPRIERLCLSSVRVIIVNYNSARLALECVRSVLEHSGENDRVGITVVENGSTDDSKEILNAAFSGCPALESVRYVDAVRNGGFGAGCNFGIRETLSRNERPDFWWLLNPDALVSAGTLDALVRVMREDSRAGIVGGSLVNWRGELMTACGPDFSPLGEFLTSAQVRSLLRRYASSIPPEHPPSERTEPGWVCGANMLIRAAALDDISGFDEDFFLYYEDADLCRGMRDAGWRVLHEPAARVVHAVGKSTQVPVAGRWPQYIFDSRCRYFSKHLGRWGLIKADICWIAGWAIRGVGRWWSMGRSAPQFPERFAADLLWTDLRSLVRARKPRRPLATQRRFDGLAPSGSEKRFPDRATIS